MAKLKALKAGAGYLEQDHRRQTEGYRFYLASWALILGALAIAGTLYISYRCYIPVPFEDEWANIEEIANHQGSYTVPLLWAQHNEHRSPFAKLLVMADLYWFKGQNISLYLELYLTQVLHWAALIWLVRRSALWPPWLVTITAGLAAFSLFWTSQFQSFINPVQVCYLPVFLFATVSLAAMMIALETPKQWSRWLVLSVACAFLAEANLANGLFVWPLILLMALRFRLRLAYTWAIAAIAAVCIAFYMVGYRSPGAHANPVESLSKPKVVIDYLMVYLGSVWGEVNYSVRGIFALCGMAAAVACFVREMLRPQPKLFPCTLLTLNMFLLITAFITALGRINFPISQAASSRYQTAALLFWLLLVLYAFHVANERGLRSSLVTAAVVLIVFTAILPYFPASVRDAKETAERVNTGSLPLFADVKDNAEIGKLIVSPDLVFAERSFLLGRATSIYADRRYQLLGQQLTQKFLVAPAGRCTGAFDTDRLIADVKFPGWELRGWAWDRQGKTTVPLLLAVTSEGVISGSGVSGFSRPDLLQAQNEITDPNAGWHVFVQGPAAMPAVSIYGIVDGGKAACLVTPTFPLPKAPIG